MDHLTVTGGHTFDMDRKIVLSCYDKLLAEAAPGPGLVGWHNVESQQVRFRVLCGVGEVSCRTSILDVGCGDGALYRFLCMLNLRPKRYLGIDIHEGLVRLAQSHFPPPADFCVRDLCQQPFDREFDYVVASGIFNLRTPNGQRWMEQTLREMFSACRLGVSVNFLSEWTPFKRDTESWYHSPLTTLQWVHHVLSPNVSLRHDYRGNDFTLYIYKEPLA